MPIMPKPAGSTPRNFSASRTAPGRSPASIPTASTSRSTTARDASLSRNASPSPGSFARSWSRSPARRAPPEPACGHPTAIVTIARFRRFRTTGPSSSSTATARGAYRLLAAQTPLGRALYVHYGLDPQDYETNILIADGVATFKSEACIRMAEGLGRPGSLAAGFRALPLSWRDRLYAILARNRLRVFGRRATCYVPDHRPADRFIA